MSSHYVLSHSDKDRLIVTPRGEFRVSRRAVIDREPSPNDPDTWSPTGLLVSTASSVFDTRLINLNTLQNDYYMNTNSGIAYDRAGGYLYYTSGATIRRRRLDGTEDEPFFSPPFPHNSQMERLYIYKGKIVYPRAANIGAAGGIGIVTISDKSFRGYVDPNPSVGYSWLVCNDDWIWAIRNPYGTLSSSSQTAKSSLRKFSWDPINEVAITINQETGDTVSPSGWRSCFIRDGIFYFSYFGRIFRKPIDVDGQIFKKSEAPWLYPRDFISAWMYSCQDMVFFKDSLYLGQGFGGSGVFEFNFEPQFLRSIVTTNISETVQLALI